ncbi:hypothetical protein KKE74_00845 [Patescibacteria group bacterium]|nr:hypothetical protein [Patescibacteria group bacterium]MBU2472561.1 hypothetical protein [Patescibacteria group bacterium]
MLSNLKQLVKKNTVNITLIVTIILVALISFGIGYLIASQIENQSIIIHNPSFNSASIQESLPKESKDALKQEKFIGSVNSNKYHWPDCPFAKRISEENQIWFSSEQEAQDAGYIRCGSFEKYAP